MIRLTINNQPVEVEPGVSVMIAAQQQGIDIPHLCYHDELEHITSCMLCLVKDAVSGKLYPSCSIKAEEGMAVITGDEEITEARKVALELLLSEHVGDCEAPCQIACPAHMNIPLMNRLIASGKFDESLKVVYRDIALPAVLGRVCPAPCEGACHRKSVDEAVSVCLLKRYVGDEGEVSFSGAGAQTGWKVAVAGAGPAGLAAALYLQLRGVQVTLFDKEVQAGGELRTSVSEEILPRTVLDREIARILDTGVIFRGGEAVDRSVFEVLRAQYDAVVVATGALQSHPEVFGLAATDKGITAGRENYRTSDPKVFAIGNVVRSSRLAVRSVGQGKEVAFSVWQFLNGQPVTGEPRMFNSRFGRLVQDEYAEYLKESIEAKRLWPSGDGADAADNAAMGNPGYTAAEAMAEAMRCMHCDCRAIDDCKLRLYSDQYQAEQRRYKTSERRRITKLDTHQTLIYEPEKCIRCGICVGLTKKYGERFGFTYIGRGFDVRIGVPFDEALENALTETANMVAAGCPTGAIELKKRDAEPDRD